MRHHIIIGNGIAGITTARHLRKRSDDRVTVISRETDHFFSRTALMYIFMGHMTYADTKPYEDEFWKKNRISLIRDTVTGIDVSEKSIQLEKTAFLEYDTLTLALGSATNYFGWPGQDLQGVQGLYSIDDLRTMERDTAEAKHAVVAGGGLIGIEMVEMLLSRGIPTTFLVREKNFWGSVLPAEESALIESHMIAHHVNLQKEDELAEMLGDASGRVHTVRTKQGKDIACDFVGITAGVHPNLSFVKDHPDIETERGILVDEYFRTSAPDIYAAGDCAQVRSPQPGRRPVEAVWYTGKIHGEYIAGNICGEEAPYNPGIWWNSAKFFDIEYQTYGMVTASCPDDESDFFWQDPKEERCLRIRYLTDSLAVTGFNLFGLRGRHAVCEHWIARRATVTEVLADLGALNFDPEFYRSFEPAIIAAWNENHPGQRLHLSTRKGLNSSFLKSLFAGGRR